MGTKSDRNKGPMPASARLGKLLEDFEEMRVYGEEIMRRLSAPKSDLADSLRITGLEAIIRTQRDAIDELDAKLEKSQDARKELDTHCCKRIAVLEAKLDRVRPYLKHKRSCPQPTDITLDEIGIDTSCTCGLQSALGDEDA